MLKHYLQSLKEISLSTSSQNSVHKILYAFSKDEMYLQTVISLPKSVPCKKNGKLMLYAKFSYCQKSPKCAALIRIPRNSTGSVGEKAIFITPSLLS